MPPMKEPCGAKCRRCTDHISEERRREVWSQYWEMKYTERRSWMFHSVVPLPTKRTTTGPESRRGRSFIYRLQDHKGGPRQVCKLFFLSTLGYHPKNDSLVISMMGKSNTKQLAPPKDQRGRQVVINKLDVKTIDDHIESFHPCVSHYRREHAPHRRYLSDITIKMMHSDYLDKGNACSYETYRKVVKEKKISFAKLGEEECEDCLEHAEHEKGHTGENANADCPECQRWQKHKESALESRLSYPADAERDWPDDTSVRSVDLQKVIMLPRMPGVKSSVFTRRIVAYHETFTSVGKRKNKKNPISVLWHEGTAGRSAAEITSAYVTALEKEREVHHSIFWVDNCSGQNKNWCLLSSLVTLVNSDTTSREDITLKFFEREHTFMSADSFHHGVEQQMRNHPGGVVYDFEDFVSVVASSNSRKVDVVQLENANVLDWRDGHSTTKVKKAQAPKLGEMAEIQVRHGSKSLFFKQSHTETDFTDLDFLLKRFELEVPTLLRPQDRGVEEAKKRNIIHNLCPLMPPNRRVFWSSLPVSNVVEDEE